MQGSSNPSNWIRWYESCKNGFETIHPSICAFNFPSLLIHFLIIQPILSCLSTVSGVGTYIRNNTVRDKGTSEFFPIKTGIKVTEESVDRYFRIRKLADDFIYPVSNLMEVGMISGLRFRHSKRNALIIRKEKSIGCASFLSSLIFSLFTSAIDRCMGSVNVGYGKVKTTFIPVENAGVYLLPFLLYRPFAIMVEDCIPCRSLSTEKMACWKKPPLASTLELVEYRVDNHHKVKFGGKTSFCYRKIGHNFRFYCIFVEYSVFRHGYSILMCRNYNIVDSLWNTLYFNYFTALLTSKNKFKQLL